MSVLSATIALSPTTAVTNQTVTATVTVSNTAGGSALTITSIAPVVTYTGGSGEVSYAAGQVNLGPGATTTVAASGSATFSLALTFFAPSTGILSNGSGTYSVGAICTSADGQVFSPTAATVTVNYAITFPTSQQ